MHMPELDGIGAARRIRTARVPGNDVLIVAMTAAATPEDRAACLEAGMDMYLSKPVRQSELAAVLASIRPRALRVSNTQG